MSAINALSTLALSGYSLPDWFVYIIAVFLVFSAIFSLPRLIKLFLNCFDK